jgi:hypothetical protein
MRPRSPLAVRRRRSERARRAFAVCEQGESELEEVEKELAEGSGGSGDKLVSYTKDEGAERGFRPANPLQAGLGRAGRALSCLLSPVGAGGPAGAGRGRVEFRGRQGAGAVGRRPSCSTAPS